MATLGLYDQGFLDRQIRENQFQLSGGVDPEIKYKKEYERINQMISEMEISPQFQQLQELRERSYNDSSLRKDPISNKLLLLEEVI